MTQHFKIHNFHLSWNCFRLFPGAIEISEIESDFHSTYSSNSVFDLIQFSLSKVFEVHFHFFSVNLKCSIQLFCHKKKTRMKNIRHLFQELMKEKEQYLGLLKQLKDFDDERGRNLAAQAYLDQERKRLEVRARGLQGYWITLSTIQQHLESLKMRLTQILRILLKTCLGMRVAWGCSSRKNSMFFGKV